VLRTEIYRLAVLCGLVLVVWCIANNRWTPEDWGVPVEYGTDPATGDTKGVLAAIQSAKEGDFAPVLGKSQPRLGAPQGAAWDDMPITEQIVLWYPGVLARIVGLFAGANLAVFIAQLLAAIAFYIAARMLGTSWTWALALGILFAFSRMATARMIHHLPVTYYWHIPLCLLVCYWLCDGSIGRIASRRWVALAIAGITGIQNPYFTAMFIQLAAISSVPQLLLRDRRTFITLLAVIGCSVIGFLVMNIPTWIFTSTHGPNPGAIQRNYQWLEFFALKPIDLFIPPPDHIVASLRAIGKSYRELVLIAGEVPPSNYLGVVGIAGFCLLLFISIRNGLSSPVRALSLEAVQSLYIVAFSIVGGLNGFAGLAGIYVFRSTNRYSIFLLAILLLFLAKYLSRLRLSPQANVILPTLICIVGLLDQLPPPPSAVAISEIRQEILSDSQFASRIESALPVGAMVFQLPFSPYPEASAPGLPAYEHFRLYLHSKSLKFSYGHVKGRGLEDWQIEVAQLPPSVLIDNLYNRGFRAITVYRAAYPNDAADLIAGLERTGRVTRIDHPEIGLSAFILLPHSNQWSPQP